MPTMRRKHARTRLSSLMASECRVRSSSKMKYLLFFPEGYDEEDRPWPLLVFLHGAAEAGSDLQRVKRHGPPKLIEAGSEPPFLVLSPLSDCAGWDVVALDQLLDEIVAEHRVDEDRVYLTGLSMGGFGTWSWAASRPERFAAIAPICGGGNPATAHRLREVPAWVFHGANDRIVPLAYSEVMVRALKRVGAEVRFTVDPDGGHDVWTAAYDDPALYQWFLGHRRRVTNHHWVAARG
jgi:predicted peptidase